MSKIITAPDHPNYDPFFDPELLALAAPMILYLKGQPVRALHVNGEILWIDIEDVESILGVEFKEHRSQPRLAVLPGGAK
jgi:hypothetical protein